MLAVLNCQKCGRCLKVCPTDAITTMDDGKARIDNSKCEECYDCVEECAHNAIVIMD